MTSSECKVCHRSASVLVTTGVRINGRWHVASECRECWAREQKRLEEDEADHAPRRAA